MDTIEESAPIRRRRRHSAEFKAKAVQECMQPGVSIAAIALHHRLNANLLRRWVAEQEAKNGAPEDRELMRVPQGEFIPLRIGEPTTAVPDIQIDVVDRGEPGKVLAEAAGGKDHPRPGLFGDDGHRLT